MLELILVRHAVAFERDPKRWRNDDLRPLTPGGVRKFRRAAAGLKSAVRPPDRLLTSSLVRARDTAALLTEVAGWRAAEEIEELSPGHSPVAVLAKVASLGNRRVALVGHEPDLGKLAAVAIAGPKATFSIEMKKGSVLCLEFAGTVRAGAGSLKAMLPPRVCRSLR